MSGLPQDLADLAVRLGQQDVARSRGESVCTPTGGAYPDHDQHDHLLPGDVCPYCRAAL